MKTLKSKTMAILTAAILIFSMTVPLIATVNGLAPGKISIPTYAYVNVAPDPAGVGQAVTIGFWINDPPPTASRTYGDRWENFKITITSPSGTTTTLGPFTSDDTGGTSTSYTPSQVGNYTFFFSFPGQILAGNNLAPGNLGESDLNLIGDYFQASNATTTLSVQQAPVPSVPQNPLPTSYWSRPIESVNDFWYTLSGNWLGLAASTFSTTGMYNASGNYNPYTNAPTTAHIMWTKPVAPGGLIGGEFGGTDISNFNAPQQYQPKFDPVIMDGILFYEDYPGSASTPTGWTAVNLQTGQTEWTITPNADLLCGQLLDYVTPNQYGAIMYLWGINPTLTHGSTTSLHLNTPPDTGTTYTLYDAMTGQLELTIVNGTGMTLTEDQGGNLIGYYTNTTVGTQMVYGKSVTNPAGGELLECWNSTQCIDELNPATPQYSYLGASEWYWEPIQGAVIPFNYGIMWAEPLATSLNGVPLPSPLGIDGSCIEDGVILMTSAGPLSVAGSYLLSGYEIEAGVNANTGALLWMTNRTLPINIALDLAPATGGAYAEVDHTTDSIVGYSITTGKEIWGPYTLPNFDPYDSIGGYQFVPANGILYVCGFGGDIAAINMATGTIIWSTTTTQLIGPSGSNTPYGVWPIWTFTDLSVAGGMLFAPIGHQYSPPMFRGANQLAINITNGQLVWENMGFDVTSGPAISDGIMAAFSSYDNQVYAYGQGPSKTTISAPLVSVITSSPITITGSVTDISAGASQQAVAANFPNGLPCVSDASMTAFMEAVYEQQAMPTNVTGVPVTLSVLDSNGNYRTIGATTTNAQGTYGFTWKPDIPGNFTVYATFAGTPAYYGSSASTCFYASSPAATAAPAATPLTGLASNTTVMYGIVAIIIVIVIIGAAIMLMLSRKRP
jgi:hypothetical protein